MDDQAEELGLEEGEKGRGQVRRHALNVISRKPWRKFIKLSPCSSLLAQCFDFSDDFMHGYVDSEVNAVISCADTAKRCGFIGTFVNEDLKHKITNAHHDAVEATMSANDHVKHCSSNYADWTIANWQQRGFDSWEETQSDESFWGHHTTRAGLHFGAKRAEEIDESVPAFHYRCAEADVEKAMIVHYVDIFASEPQSSKEDVVVSETFCLADPNDGHFAPLSKVTAVGLIAAHGSRGANTDIPRVAGSCSPLETVLGACPAEADRLSSINEQANALLSESDAFTGDTSAGYGIGSSIRDHGSYVTQKHAFFTAFAFGRTRVIHTWDRLLMTIVSTPAWSILWASSRYSLDRRWRAGRTGRSPLSQATLR